MAKQKKLQAHPQTRTPGQLEVSLAAEELSAAVEEFDRRAESWARIPETRQVART